MNPTYILIGIGAGLIWIFRKPLGWIGGGAASLVDQVATSPVFTEPDYALNWVQGVPEDIGRLLDPPLPPPPEGTPIDSDAYLRWLWKDSGEYHPIYNP